MKKKTLNQLRASKRNFALWCLAGIITKLYYIKRFARDTQIVIKINTIITAIERLQSAIRETTYESWSA